MFADRVPPLPQQCCISGRSGASKGAFEVLEAAWKLRSQLPELRFHLAGDWYPAMSFGSGESLSPHTISVRPFRC